VKPVAKKAGGGGTGGGGGNLAKFLPIGLGVVGVVLLVGLIYVGLQFIPASTGEEIRRLKLLQDGYSSMAKLRNTGTAPSAEDLKTAKDKILEATKTVTEELKKIEKKNKYQEALKALVTKMKSVAAAEFDEKQKSKAEIDVSAKISQLEKDLGLK